MSLNVVALTGRLVADPELRMTTTGKEVATFRIAVDRPKTKDSIASTADFFTVVAWNSTATFVSRYFIKGSPIAVNGRLQSRSYETGNGEKRTVIEVVAQEVSFIGSNAVASAPTSTPTNAPNYSTTGNPTNLQPGYTTASASDFEAIDDDEDMPF